MLETASAKIDRFNWANMDQNIKSAICADWCDVLSKYTLAEIRDGIRAVFANAGGKLRSINEYQVEAQILNRHRIALAKLQRREPEPDRTRATPEQVAKMVEAAGYSVKRF